RNVIIMEVVLLIPKFVFFSLFLFMAISPLNVFIPSKSNDRILLNIIAVLLLKFYRTFLE
ncbi:MAG: hypothetical protein V3U20_04230, partial [Thermoplasmata archaeon]